MRHSEKDDSTPIIITTPAQSYEVQTHSHDIQIDEIGTPSQLHIQSKPTEIESHRTERKRQALSGFNIVLVFAWVGLAVIVSSAVAVLVNMFIADPSVLSLLSGASVAVVGLITNGFALIAFRISERSNNCFDEVGRTLTVNEAVTTATEILSKISNSEKRDDALRDIATALLQQATGVPDKTKLL